jgi:hypothetical protein
MDGTHSSETLITTYLQDHSGHLPRRLKSERRIKTYRGTHTNLGKGNKQQETKDKIGITAMDQEK